MLVIHKEDKIRWTHGNCVLEACMKTKTSIIGLHQQNCKCWVSLLRVKYNSLNVCAVPTKVHTKALFCFNRLNVESLRTCDSGLELISIQMHFVKHISVVNLLLMMCLNITNYSTS